jgi:hypothetical protein
MVEMAQSVVRRRSNSSGCHLGGCPWSRKGAEGLGDGEQHTIAVATTVVC